MSPVLTVRNLTKRYELGRIPGAFGPADVLYWFAYLAVLCLVLYLALRRKQA